MIDGHLFLHFDSINQKSSIFKRFKIFEHYGKEKLTIFPIFVNIFSKCEILIKFQGLNNS